MDSTRCDDKIERLRSQLRDASNPQAQLQALTKAFQLFAHDPCMSANIFLLVLQQLQSLDPRMQRLVISFIEEASYSVDEVSMLAIGSLLRLFLSCEESGLRIAALKGLCAVSKNSLWDEIDDYVVRAMKDSCPKVRAASALCALRRCEQRSDISQDMPLIQTLVQMLSDSCPLVVANSLKALTDLSTKFHQPLIESTVQLRERLFHMHSYPLPVLEFFSQFVVEDEQDARRIAFWAKLHLLNSLPEVVTAAALVIAKHFEWISSNKLRWNLCCSVSSALISLITHEQSEIRFVAIRNACVLTEKIPGLLLQHVHRLSITKTDPVYIIDALIELLPLLTTTQTTHHILSQLQCHITHPNPEVVSKAILGIANCAVKFEPIAGQCVNKLVGIARAGTQTVVQRVLVALTLIFRCYPNCYESAIVEVCDFLESLSDSEAKASLIWVVGEFVDRVQNAAELLMMLAQDFETACDTVQCQLITATVKYYLACDNDGTFTTAILRSGARARSPDVRERALFYWRLLRTDADAAKAVVFCSKPKPHYCPAELSSNWICDVPPSPSTPVHNSNQSSQTVQLPSEACESVNVNEILGLVWVVPKLPTWIVPPNNPAGLEICFWMAVVGGKLHLCLETENKGTTSLKNTIINNCTKACLLKPGEKTNSIFWFPSKPPCVGDRFNLTASAQVSEMQYDTKILFVAVAFPQAGHKDMVLVPHTKFNLVTCLKTPGCVSEGQHVIELSFVVDDEQQN